MVALILVAAGNSTRFGGSTPKPLQRISGKTLLWHAVSNAIHTSVISAVVSVVPSKHREEMRAEVQAALRDNSSDAWHTDIVGGVDRTASVAAGIRTLDTQARSESIVLVHDAARALTPPEVFTRVIDAVRSGHDGVIPVLPVTDTVKRVDHHGGVRDTLQRSQLRSVQTPQGFERSVLRRAHEMNNAATDDAALVESMGVSVHTVEGDRRAVKVTHADDLAYAEILSGGSVLPRVGVGSDTHRYSAAQPCWIAGVHWEGEPGCSGHSDGDVVAHAVCDAVFAATGLGDMGSNYGTSRREWADASGVEFLRETARRVEEAGFRIGNVSVQLIAEHPRIGDRRSEAEKVMSHALGASVTLTATTTDGLGFTGRGEGATAIATAVCYSCVDAASSVRET